MSETPDIGAFMTVLSEELATWSRTSRNVEGVCGTLAERSGATPAEIQALQSLDQISQHLAQLARLCGDLGNDLCNDPSNSPQTRTAIHTAIDRLDLSNLKARLSRADSGATDREDIELW